MSLQQLLPRPLPARDVIQRTTFSHDIQQTAFSHDIMDRYVCNSWAQVSAAQTNGGYPFDAVIIGAGLFGGYCAERLYRFGSSLALRILVLDAGAFPLPSGVRNLPAVFPAAQPATPSITAVKAAPLSGLGSPPATGLFAFDKFSSGPFLTDAIHNDIGVNTGYGDVSRRIFLVPRVRVLRLNLQGNTVASIDLVVDGQRQTLPIAPACAVVIANGTLEAALGPANPSLTALPLARRTSLAIIQAATPTPAPGFSPLSLDPKDWQMVQPPGPIAVVRHYGQVLETTGSHPKFSYGLYWYMKETFANFILRIDWRVARLDDNSGIYIRLPAPTVPSPLAAADNQGLEIQIDERGFDSATNTAGNANQQTGAICKLSAPTSFPSNPIGAWNTFFIEANGSQIKVALNGLFVNTYLSNRLGSGYIALQAHHGASRVQFRNLQIKKLP
ncbi:MAG TPA: family 16 glycoside hydrolase [Candidatus Binatia bacterium]|jgi:hypothetical protein|nr:family 16 glycoside hydrolase [Candidatus Binatia bacterium]